MQQPWFLIHAVDKLKASEERVLVGASSSSPLKLNELLQIHHWQTQAYNVAKQCSASNKTDAKDFEHRFPVSLQIDVMRGTPSLVLLSEVLLRAIDVLRIAI